MNWLEAQMALIDAATLVAQFAVNWLVQSTLLIAAGLTIARLLRGRGSAVQSVVYRTTLAAVLVCPLATWTLSQTGVSGWSVKLPAGWTYHEIETAPIVIDVSDSAAEPTSTQPSTAPPASLETPPAPFPLGNDPAMSIDSSSMPPLEIAADAAEQAESPRVVAESPPEPSTAAASTMTRIFSVQRIGWAALGMTAGWLFLSGLLGTRLAVAWRRLARLRRGSLSAEPEILSDCHDLASLLNVSPPEVLRSAFLPSPCLVGLRRPAVMLPDGELSLPLRDTLIHELAHLKRHDCHWNLLRQAAVAAFFFQPLLWKLSRRIEQAAEEVCDDYVIHYGSDRQEYAHCLVDVAELSSAPIAAAGVGIVSLRSMLARRVTRILDTSRSLSTRAGNLLLAAVLIGGVTGTTIVGLVGLDPQSTRAGADSIADESDTATDNQRDDAGNAVVAETIGNSGDPRSSISARLGDPRRKESGSEKNIIMRGRVVGDTGQPIQEASVEVIRSRWINFQAGQVDHERLQTTFADENGRFTVEVPHVQDGDPYKYRFPQLEWRAADLVASAPGYASTWVRSDNGPYDREVVLRLTKEPAPIRGRLLNLEGQPLPGLSVRVKALGNAERETIKNWLADVESLRAEDKLPKPGGAKVYTYFFTATAAMQEEDQSTSDRRSAYYPGSAFLAAGHPMFPDGVKTDDLGRFEIVGLAPNQLVTLEVAGPGIVHHDVTVVNRKMEPLNIASVSYYGAKFDHPVTPGITIQGVVKDIDSGEPLVGATVMSSMGAGSRSSIEGKITSITDHEGRFRIEGMPVGKGNELKVIPADGQPYLITHNLLVPESDGREPVGMEIALRRGVFVTGRVMDADTGQPVEATVHYHPFLDNPHAERYQRYDPSRSHSPAHTREGLTNDDGSFRVVAIPGQGILAAHTLQRNAYCVGMGAEQIDGLDKNRQRFATYDICSPRIYNRLAQINIPAGSPEFAHDLKISRGGKLLLKAVDPAGQLLTGVRVSNRTPSGSASPDSPDADVVEVVALRPGENRRLLMLHQDRRLARILTVHAPKNDAAGEPKTVQLQPCGMVTGRLVNGEREPVSRIHPSAHLLPAMDMGITAETVVTNETGNFRFKYLAPGGRYRLAGNHQDVGWVELSKELEVQPGETIDLGTIDVTSDERPDPVRTVNRAASKSNGKIPGDRRVAADHSYSGHVTDTDGHPVRDARIWMVAWKRSDEMRETLYELYQDRYELGRTDEQGNFSVRWNAQVWGESAAAIMASRPMLAAHAPDHGLDWLHLEIFDDHPVASSKRDELEVKIDKAFGAGRFAGRTLKLPPQQPIRGRLVDLEGRPLSDVTVRVEALKRPDMQILTQAFERSSKDLVWKAMRATAPVDGFHRTVLHKFVSPPTTDGEGRFELTGIGRDQLATLSFHGDGLQSQQIHVLGRAMDVVQLPHIQRYPNGSNGSKDVYVGRDFTFALGPSIPVSGIVKDFDTGMPVPETVVFVNRLFSERGGAAEGQLRVDTKHMRAITDEQGRFRITGMPPGKGHELIAVPPKTEPYLMAKKTVSPRAEDSETTVEMQVKKGIWIQGRLTDKQSGEPIHGTVDYLALQKNPFSLDKLGLRQGWEMQRYWTDRDGRYRVVGLPGPGVLLAINALGTKVYPQAIGAETVDGYRADNRFIPTTPVGLPVTNWQLIKQIDPAEDAESFTCDLVLDAGQSIPGRVIGPAGDPVLQLNVLGEVLNDGFWQLRANGKFDVKNYDGQGPRQLFFKSQDESLIGQFRLEGDAPKQITITLQPSVRVTGQLIESETGLPAEGYKLYCEKSSSGYFRIADVLTDDAGRFEIKGLLSGAVYEMRSANPQHFSSGRNNFTIDLRNAKPGDVVEVGTVPRQVTNKGAMVAGRVLLADGEPASGAHVAVIAWRIETKRRGDLSSHTGILAESVTDEDGLYRLNLEKVSNKTHRDANLVARKDGTAVAWKQLDLDKTQTEVDLKLPPEEPVSVRLVDIEGQPAAGVKVPVQIVKKRTTNGVWGWSREAVGFPAGMPAPAAWLPAATTDEQGRCTLRGVPAGHGVYLKVAGNDRFAPQGISLNTGMPEQRVGRDRTYRSLVKNVDAGEEAVLPLAPAQVFEGAVSYEDTGQPAPNARMTIWASQVGISSMVSVEGRADSAGKYRITPRPGTRFGITAYSPDGTAYLVRTTPHLEAIQWKTGDRVRRVDISLPRGVLVRGRIVEEGSGTAVAGASIQYVPESENNPHTADDIITGWQGFELSDKQGSFSIAVLPGPGRLLVHGPDGRYVLQEIGDRQLSSGKPGGMRNYAHAIAKIHPDENAPPIDITIPLKPGATASGRMVDEQGELAEEVLVISRLHIRPHNLDWCGQIPPTLGGRFELAGLQPGQQYPVSFLDAKRRLGATVTIQADDKDPTVVLKPCGQASARFLDPEGQPHVGFRPGLYMIVTPGADREDFEAARRGELNADADFVANIDQVNHWPMPPTDQHGRVTFPALIPGTTYLLVYSKPKFRKEFTIEPGQHLELGDITVDVEVPKSDAP